MQPVNIGLIGCGNISGTYLRTLQQFPEIRLIACADQDPARAQVRATEFGIAADSVESLLARPEIEMVVNLTTPAAHFEICLAALEAGKHVHVEKPLGITLEQGEKLLATAERNQLRIGVAPDTFLGGGFQTCRKLIDDGWIGEPIGAFASVLNHGHEHWHPNPDFYYEPGGGPMFDLGPYYLATLISLIGPLTGVTGSARTTFPTRTITSQPRYGQSVRVEVPTHVLGLLDFAGGGSGMLITTFDVWASQLPWIEIYGSEGTLSTPDPNWFGGPVRIKRQGATDWSEVPLTHGFNDRGNRGIGAVDLALALRSGRPHRCSAEMGLHVLEAMHGIHVSAETGRRYDMRTVCQRPAPIPIGPSLMNRIDDAPAENS
ncbi:MAG: Gfo/Idh/MocA family oxidoreductase [Capsulimonadales bacterium]|nr:Gfo/Idh/MocA family oxidoreductase [Capsulimonadales bacterium]